MLCNIAEAKDFENPLFENVISKVKFYTNICNVQCEAFPLGLVRCEVQWNGNPRVVNVIKVSFT
jgi:hypothetical protein